jgi:hypothetical protein
MSKDAAVVITKFRSPEYSCSEYRVAYMQAYSNLYESPYYVFNAYVNEGPLPTITLANAYASKLAKENELDEADIINFNGCSMLTWTELCKKTQEESVKFSLTQPEV